MRFLCKFVEYFKMTYRYRLHIIELDYHHDVLDALIRLVDTSKFEISLSTRRFIYDNLSQEVKEMLACVLIQGENGVDLNQIAAQEADLHIFNTLASHYAFWAKNLPQPHLVRMHNIHSWFDPASFFSIGKTPLEWRKSLSYLLYNRLLLGEGVHMRRLKEKIQHFSFMSQSNQEYFSKNYPKYAHKIIDTLPTAWATYLPEWNADSETLRIVIPGTPEFKRKDFTLVEKLIQWAEKRKEKIEIYFAGKSPHYMRNKMQALKMRANDRLSIHVFSHFLSGEEFDRILKSADLLFFPIKETTRYKVFTENYGQSKISGSENDFMRFGRMSLFPAFYPLQSPLILHADATQLDKVLDHFMSHYKVRPDNMQKAIEEHRVRFSFDASFKRQNEILINLVASYEKN